jgi:hypothetical protein
MLPLREGGARPLLDSGRAVGASGRMVYGRDASSLPPAGGVCCIVPSGRRCRRFVALHYFLPVMEELLEQPLEPECVQYLAGRLRLG